MNVIPAPPPHGAIDAWWVVDDRGYSVEFSWASHIADDDSQSLPDALGPFDTAHDASVALAQLTKVVETGDCRTFCYEGAHICMSCGNPYVREEGGE